MAGRSRSTSTHRNSTAGFSDPLLDSGDFAGFLRSWFPQFRAASADGEPRVRLLIKRSPVHDGSGCAVHTALAGSPQEPIQHRLDVAGLNPLLQGGAQPRGGRVV